MLLAYAKTEYLMTILIEYEPLHEKQLFLHMRKKAQISCAVLADQRLCFRFIDGTNPLLLKSENSSLLASSDDVQPDPCRTWLETPKTGFLATLLILLLTTMPAIV